MIQHFENHLNQDSLIKDLIRTEEFNPYSGELEELNPDMVKTEMFTLYELLLKYSVVIAHIIGKLASYTAHAANACILRKGTNGETMKYSVSCVSCSVLFLSLALSYKKKLFDWVRPAPSIPKVFGRSWLRVYSWREKSILKILEFILQWREYSRTNESTSWFQWSKAQMP